MKTHDPIIRRELPLIEKIIADETWLEGERRGTAVERHDPVVMARVCTIILCIGAQLRAQMQAELAVEFPPRHERHGHPGAEQAQRAA